MSCMQHAAPPSPLVRRGGVTLLVAAGMALFCGVAAVVIDVGRVYIQRTKIQAVSEAAAIAGGQKLGEYVASGIEIHTTEEDAVRAEAIRYAAANGVTLESSDVVVTGDRVFVYKPETVDYTFAKLIGFESKEVAGNAIAKVNGDGSVGLSAAVRYNVMPWAMAHGIITEPYSALSRNVELTPQAALTPGREYVLKLGGGPQAGGVFYPTGTQVLVPMAGAIGDWDQWNIGFKRAYGLAYWLAGQGYPVKWLLGYRGGSFMFDLDEELMRQLGAMRTSGGGEFGDAGVFIDATYFQWVKYEIVEDATSIIQQTTSIIVIDRAPRIAVYSSNVDAVILTLDDAGLPYTLMHDEGEILAGALNGYDWLHLHHEDFTGGGNDGGLAVPSLVSVSDKTGSFTDGPSGGTIWIKGKDFSNYENGHRDITVWFDDTALRLTDTATYSTDYLSADRMLVNSDDNSRWEVTATVPLLPNGTYRVYAQVKDEYTQPLYYTISGSVIQPTIVVDDGSGNPLEGPDGGTLRVGGSGFGSSTPHIYLKFGGSVIPVAATTALYADDNAVDGFITANPAGSWEVEIGVPGWFTDGTYEIQAILEQSTSNVEIYKINNYRNPVITLRDEFGDPSRGPAGETVTVSGSQYRPGQAGINVLFDGSPVTVSDTATHGGDLVVGASDITANGDGLFEVTFTAPAVAEADYAVRAEHLDTVSGLPLATPTLNYHVQDFSGLTPEVCLADATGGDASGWAGTKVYVTGSYFPVNPDDIRLYLFSTPVALAVTDEEGYPGDQVNVDGFRITADPAGRFRVAFVVPEGTAEGTHEVRACYNGGAGWSTVAEYVVGGHPATLQLYDTVDPDGIGTAGAQLFVQGDGFPPDVATVRVLFDGQAVTTLYDAWAVTGDAIMGQHIMTNGEGRFDCWFYTPYLPPGTYKVTAETSPGVTTGIEYDYTLETAEDFWTATVPGLSPEANAFTMDDTLYLKALCTNVDKTQIVHAEATLTCAYHGTHTVTVPLLNNGDFSHSGSIAWSAVPGVHNGDWNVAFHLEDVAGRVYQPETSVHLSGTANVTASAIVSRKWDYTDQFPMLKVSERQYFKIQSPDVDYSDMEGGSATARIVCRTGYDASGYAGAEHNSGLVELTNNWNGIWTGSYQCPLADQHYGDHLVHLKVEDRLGRTYEQVKTVCFFSAYSEDKLVSAYPYYDYSTGNFYKHGNIYARFFKRSMNYLDMKYARYRYKRYYGSSSNTTPSTSSWYNLVNEGNGMFQKEESLSGYQNRGDYYKFRMYYSLSDNNNVTYGGTSSYVEFTLRNTVTGNPFAEAYTVAGGDPLGALANLVATAGRAAGSVMSGDPLYRGVEFERREDGWYLDGRRHELSPAAPAAPETLATTFAGGGRAPFGWMTRDEAAPCACETLAALVSRYRAAPADAATWWAAERPAPGEPLPETGEASGGPRSWFASPARAAAYTGKYELVHAFRNWVVNGGYMFAMCYGAETIDITLSKDDRGNAAGYASTFAFENFGSNRINDDDSGNFTLQDMTDSGDEYDRPLAITQDHMTTLEGFTGSCTAFKRAYLKSTTGPNNSPIYSCGEIDAGTVKYLGAPYGAGWFTFLGGHDPRLTEVYRLILNNILIGSLSVTIPASNMANYMVLDMDCVDEGEAVDKGEYATNVKFGYPPSRIGEIVTGYPGDLPGDPLLDTFPFNCEAETEAGVDHLVAHDMDRAEAGEVHTWRTPEAGTSRYVLVPLCTVYKSDGSLTCAQPQNLVEPLPEHVYDVLGRDKVRLLRYGLFYLSGRAPVPSGDPDIAETGSLRDGEVRGKFIGYLK